MANEAVPIITPTKFTQVTVADGTGIEKYTVMKVSSDPNTALASAGQDKFAGIAMFEKVASDGSTTMTCALDGEWDVTCNAGVGITLGAEIALSGANLFRAAVEADYPLGAVCGKALETVSASEVFRARFFEA